MPVPARPRTIAVPAVGLSDLARLLIGIDVFLRSGSPATASLTGFLTQHAETRPDSL
jgi:hypothetical protein